MANGNTTTTPGSTVSTGGLNYDDYQKRIQDAAARTRNVEWPSAGVDKLSEAAQGIINVGGAGDAARSLVEQVGTQRSVLESQAERAASALEMVGSSTLQGVQNIEALQGQVRQQVQNASDSWNLAAEKADEYVQAARGRVGEVLTKLDTLSQDMMKTRDFSKAHAMQASVQAVMGSMKDEERNVLQNYGADSKEYDQFRASKMSALATVQSNIHANYAQLEEQQKQTYLSAVSDAYTKSNMYLGFQEQQHVEMLKYKSEAENAYTLQATQLDASLEQMKMSGMENLANWIIETPTFSMDLTPVAAMIADLGAQSMASYSAWKTAKRSGKSGGSDWGTVASTGLGIGVGALTGGVGTALAGGLSGAMGFQKEE